MKRNLIRVLTLLATVLILGCRGGEPTPLEIGDLAPDFSLPAVGPTSGKLTSGQLRGKISVVNFWSTTCAVCLKETEDLARIHDSGKALVIGIALDSDAEYLGRFVKERGIPYPVAQGDEDTFSRYDGYAVPYTLVLDRERSVRKRVYGRIDEEDLKRVIAEIDRSTVALETPRPIR